MKIICPSIMLSFILSLSLVHPAEGQSWTLTTAPTNAWYSVRCSADGSRIAAAANPGLIYLSADGGVTWAPAQSAPSNTWYSIACSADGTNLIAAGGGAVYTSVDAGFSWRSNQVDWSAIPSTPLISASSPDGAVLLAGGQAIGLFTSTNAGVTWNSNKVVFPNSRWLSAICAENGARMYAVQEGGLGMWASTNYGAAWAPLRSPNRQWQGMAASASGRQLTAPAYQTGIYLSTNYGSSWLLTSAPPLNWQAIANSADGSNLVATTGVLFTINPNHYGPIYLSTDGGAHWNQSAAPTNTWASVASSADGHAVVAVANGGGIYTFHTSPAPALNVNVSKAGTSLSWTIPSVTLRLQHTTDLATANWTDVPAPPSQDLTNLQDTVALPYGSQQAAGFYRLVGP